MYLHGAAGKARKQEARAAAELAETQRLAEKVAAKTAKKAAQAEVERQKHIDPVVAMLGFEVPKKIGGIPFWMLAAGGLMAVMFVFSGGKRR